MGATAAYALLLDDTVTDLTLIDAQKEKAEGVVLDMEHSLSFVPFKQLSASGDMAACAGSQLVVVTAGKRQTEGQTRLDLAAANTAIFADIIPQIARAAPDAILLIVSNPLDVLTRETIRLSGFPPSRVFGSGTILDTARLQFHISEVLHINPHSIDAYILGEHGNSSFPVWSSATVVGKRLSDFPAFTRAAADACYEKTRTAAARIIHDVGFTCYSIGTAIREVTRAIYEDSHQVFMLSTLLDGYYGHRDVCASVPCVLGRAGIVQTIDIPLDAREQEQLAKSVATIRSFQS